MNETTYNGAATDPKVKVYPDQHCTFLMEQARQFRDTYRIHDSKSHQVRTRQLNLITEEFKEFLDSTGTLYRSSPECHADCLKELDDLVYVCYQFAANMNWDLDEAMHRVHESNMSKLDEYGKPIFREDGKVLKGPRYQPPNLEDLV